MWYGTSQFFEQGGYRVKDREKARVFEAILSEGSTSRKRLFHQLQLRPNSVSNSVQQLLADGLVAEHQTVRSGRQGRPEIALEVNEQRIVAVGVWVISRAISGALVYLDGGVRNKRTVPVREEANNEEFFEALFGLIDGLADEVPETGDLAGIGLSLPGLVNSHTLQWAYNSRWVGVRGLDLGELRKRFSVPISVHRMLDAELESLLLEHEDSRDGNTLLFHWGYGIGAAFAIDGEVVRSPLGSFCEVGHLKLAEDPTAVCTCGESGCLESQAAGWALLPELRRELGQVPEDETEFATLCETYNLKEIEAVRRATVAVSRAVDTLYRVLFPSRILVFGPFVRNVAVATQLQEHVRRLAPDYSTVSPHVEILTGGTEFGEVRGSTRAFFETKLAELLAFG